MTTDDVTPAIESVRQAAAWTQARMMHEHDVKRLPVVDDDGRIVGIVSRMDLLAELLRDDDDIEAEVARVLADELGSSPGRSRCSWTTAWCISKGASSVAAVPAIAVPCAPLRV